MNETLVTRSAPKTAAEYRVAIDSLLAEMSRIDEKMAEEQAEIDRLKFETRQIAASSDVRLARLEAQMTALRSRV